MNTHRNRFDVELQLLSNDSKLGLQHSHYLESNLRLLDGNEGRDSRTTNLSIMRPLHSASTIPRTATQKLIHIAFHSHDNDKKPYTRNITATFRGIAFGPGPVTTS